MIRDKISKRVIGAICLGLAMTMGVTLFGLSITYKISDPEVSKYVVSTFFLTGLGLLGIDAGGKIFKK